MKIILNGDEQSAEPGSLESLLEALGYQGEWLATAVNGELVHRPDRSTFALSDGDRIEVLAPMQGG